MRKIILFFLLLILVIIKVASAQWGHSGFTDFGPNHSWQIWHWDPNGYYGSEASPPTVWSALEELGAEVFPPSDNILQVNNTDKILLVDGSSELLRAE